MLRDDNLMQDLFAQPSDSSENEDASGDTIDRRELADMALTVNDRESYGQIKTGFLKKINVSGVL